MNFFKLNFLSLIVVTLLIITGCGSSGNMTDNQETEMEFVTLRDHLEREINVSFSGNKVYIRSSFGAFQGRQLEPLFIINDMNAGRGFTSAKNVISGREIETVKVYKPSETGTRWGGDGAYGVVVVTTEGTS